MTSLTAVKIPCCLCGTMIFPNSANQCTKCLAQEVDLQGLLQRGPGGSSEIVMHQCRQCRNFQVTERLWKPMAMESSELLSACLKHLPALNAHSHAAPKIKVVDAMWIWTEPHSMRLKIRLSVRATIQGVDVQQRLPVELKIQFQQCPECNREYTNRTWHAVVQLRQKRTDDAPKKGLAALEMALARNAQIRQHVLKIDANRNGFDFYFLTLPEAQSFASYLARVAPMRIKTSTQLVSQDYTNNTANLKHAVSCDLVPLCRDDLILIHKSARGSISGRLAVVTKVNSIVHLVDASPKRAPTMEQAMSEIHPETYHKSGGEKVYPLIQASHRMIRFVVLDVELCGADQIYQPTAEDGETTNLNSQAGATPFALADVEVARESDFGQNDETFRCVTHLGNLLHPGDVVLGYDVLAGPLSSGEWQDCFQSNFVLPDVVLVKKVKERTLQKEQATADAQDEEKAAFSGKGKGRKSKRKDKQRLRQNRKAKELEESALRMGFVPEEGDDGGENRDDFYQDPDMVADMEEMERNLGAIDISEPQLPEAADTEESEVQAENPLSS